MIPDKTWKKLETAAKTAALQSYSPYSRFPVGAAVIAGSGKVYTGANVENASFGLCNCAERTAIFSAVAAGERRIRAVAIYTPTTTATMPCGACRQVINEFGPGAEIVSHCKSKERIHTTMAKLLPGAFGPSSLR